MTTPTCLCGDPAVTTIKTGTDLTGPTPVARYRDSCWACALEWARERDWSQSDRGSL